VARCQVQGAQWATQKHRAEERRTTAAAAAAATAATAITAAIEQAQTQTRTLARRLQRLGKRGLVVAASRRLGLRLRACATCACHHSHAPTAPITTIRCNRDHIPASQPRLLSSACVPAPAAACACRLCLPPVPAALCQLNLAFLARLSPDRQSTRPPLPSHSSALPSKLLARLPIVQPSLPRFIHLRELHRHSQNNRPAKTGKTGKTCHCYHTLVLATPTASLSLRQACQVGHTIQHLPRSSTYFVITLSQMATPNSIATLTWMLTPNWPFTLK
jgi:hypothetical protein